MSPETTVRTETARQTASTVQTETAGNARMTSPALSVPGLLEALQGVAKTVYGAARKAGLPQSTIELVNLRVSQINGCAVCLDMHSRALQNMGQSHQRLHTVAAWRETPYFDDAERAALGLAEAATRLADRADAVPDDVFAEAAKHFDEPALAALVAAIATINVWNRLNAATRQPVGTF